MISKSLELKYFKMKVEKLFPIVEKRINFFYLFHFYIISNVVNIKKHGK